MPGNECHNSLENEKNRGRGLLFSEKRLGDKGYQEEIKKADSLKQVIKPSLYFKLLTY